jgi:CxxC motif-containing protein
MKDYVCIICPNGCEIAVECDAGVITKISGNLCPKGEAYVKKELSSPERGVTSTVVVLDGTLPLVSVKTTKLVPKDRVFDVMDAIAGIEVEAPVRLGEILLRNVAGTGADIAATRTVEKR